MSLDPTSLEDVLEDILRVGQATDKIETAKALVASLRGRIESVRRKAALARSRPRVACLEWLEPLIVAGHWVPEMVELAGGDDCFGEKQKASFGVEWEKILEQRPEVVVVLPCGFDVRRSLKEVDLLTGREGWHELPAAENRQVFVTDASAYFSRSGPRLVEGLEMLAEMIHPELFSGMVPQEGAIRLYGEPFRAAS